MFDHITCLACGRTIREKSDDIALSHNSEPKPVMFFHSNRQCREIAQRMRRARGRNEWSLTHRSYMWCPVEAEGWVR